MKVLNIMSRFNVGGTSQWLYHLSLGLTAQGIENRLLIGDCPSYEQEDSRLPKISHTRVLGLGPKTSISSSLKAFLQLRREIKSFNPTIINTHTSKAGVMGRLAALTLGVNATVVHTYHGHVLHGYFNPLLVAVIRIVEKFLSRITDYSFVVGEKVKRDLERAGVIDPKRSIAVWPAVADLESRNGPAIRETLGIDKASLVIGFLGRKVQIKRLDRILAIAEEMPNQIFLIAGDGPLLRNSAQPQFNDSVKSNVIEVGFMSASEFWSAVDICIMTSDNEGMPSAPIEAALANKPTVATDVGSISEVVVDGQTGLLCKTELSSIIHELEKLVKDDALREQMGKNAREYAFSKFNPASSVRRQIEGYRLAQSTKSRD